MIIEIIVIEKIIIKLCLIIWRLPRCSGPGFSLQYFALRDKMIFAAIPNPNSVLFEIFINYQKLPIPFNFSASTTEILR